MISKKESGEAEGSGSGSVRRWAAFLTGIVIAHGILALVTWNRLPTEIPLHFDASGAPDRFGPPTVFAWFGPLVVSALMSLFIGAIAGAIPKIPLKYLSLPRKKEFLDLHKDAQRRLLATVSAHTLILAATMAVVFTVLQILMYLASVGEVESFPAWIVFAAMALMIAQIVIMIVSFSRGLEAELGARGARR